MQGTSSDHSIYLSSDYFFHCCLPAQAQEKDLNNAIINAAFLLLYKDLIRLFASYNEGMINLIGKILSKRFIQCNAFECCSFVVCLRRTFCFVQVAVNIFGRNSAN